VSYLSIIDFLELCHNYYSTIYTIVFPINSFLSFLWQVDKTCLTNLNECIYTLTTINCVSVAGLCLLPAKKLETYTFPNYLAGLIEGDGSIIVPDEHTKSYTPYFEIVFHIEDKYLAEIIQLKIGGVLRFKTNYCVLVIKSKMSVLKIIHLINGNLRTPKIEALGRMINWFNLNRNCNMQILDLDTSPLNSNSWLSGFIDADGSFYLNWLYDKKGKPTSLQYYMRLSQRQIYHRDSLSYYKIMSGISNFLSVPLRSRLRHRKNDYIETSFEVRSGSYISNYILLSYLINYPLFSYKFKAIPVQVELLQLSKSRNYKLMPSGLEKLNNLKERLQYHNDSNSENARITHLNYILNYFPL